MIPEPSFFHKLEEVKKIISNIETSISDMSKLNGLLQDPDVLRSFFRLLDEPQWIPLLRSSNYFDSPPIPTHVSDAEIQYPVWPQSRYLARMANKDPESVAEILSGLITQNTSVVADMLDAALAMPTKFAVRIAPQISDAIKHGRLKYGYKEASDYCMHLMADGEFDTALDLATVLFAPRFANDKEAPDNLDVYWFKEGFSRVLPILAPHYPEYIPRLLCEWLEMSVRAKNSIGRSEHNDYSYVWRPAIEQHEENLDFDFSSTMVETVVQGFELVIKTAGLRLVDALSILRRHSSLVFRRIEVHLINQFASYETALARLTILDKRMFENHHFKHEYAMLVGGRFNLLPERDKATWLGWVHTGPDMSEFDRSVQEGTGRTATEDDRIRRQKYWKLEKLHLVRRHLEGERLMQYERLLSEFGEPEMAEMNIRSYPMRWGYDSPMTVDELAALAFEEAVEAVCTWRPNPDSAREADMEGLAHTFETYVATNPELFSTKANLLTDRPAIYARVYIEQMADGVKADKSIDIDAVLALCKWVVDRPIIESTTGATDQRESLGREWQWLRDATARFAGAVVRANMAGDDGPKFGLEFRERVWELLEALCQDDKSSYIVRETSQEDPRLHDYLNLAINSPRGKAVETALDYARWVADHLLGTKSKVGPGFDNLAEVRTMLEWQVDPSHSSYEAMAAIGSKMGLIYWIDKIWLQRNANELFNLKAIETSPNQAHGWAAWNAFLCWVRPHPDFYRIFEQQYSYAVDQSAMVTSNDSEQLQPMRHLGEHMMVLFGRGALDLDDPIGTFSRFMTKAEPEVRRHAIGFVGISVAEAPVSTEVLARFQRLWDFYWQDKGPSDAQEEPTAWTFGKWFASGKFSGDWSLRQLTAFTELVPLPEPDHDVADQLAKVASIDPLQSVTILDRMVRGDKEGWHVSSWRDEAKVILRCALAASDDATTVAEQVIDVLGRRGYLEFGELLHDTQRGGR